MTDRIGHARQLVGQARRDLAPAGRHADQGRLRIHVDIPGAKVMLLPGRFRDAAYVKRHVEFVLSRSAEQGEEHVRRNLVALRQNLEEMGVDQTAIDAEVQRVEGVVRAELWKQVLLPGGDQ